MWFPLDGAFTSVSPIKQGPGGVDVHQCFYFQQSLKHLISLIILGSPGPLDVTRQYEELTSEWNAKLKKNKDRMMNKIICFLTQKDVAKCPGFSIKIYLPPLQKDVYFPIGGKK